MIWIILWFIVGLMCSIYYVISVEECIPRDFKGVFNTVMLVPFGIVSACILYMGYMLYRGD